MSSCAGTSQGSPVPAQAMGSGLRGGLEGGEGPPTGPQAILSPFPATLG